jgi:hypothetical protein
MNLCYEVFAQFFAEDGFLCLVERCTITWFLDMTSFSRPFEINHVGDPNSRNSVFKAVETQYCNASNIHTVQYTAILVYTLPLGEISIG